MNEEQLQALQCYDSYQKERMGRVIRAINDGRLIYIRFFEDNSGASFYFRELNDIINSDWYFLFSFNAKQTNIILTGCLINIKSFGL